MTTTSKAKADFLIYSSKEAFSGVRLEIIKCINSGINIIIIAKLSFASYLFSIIIGFCRIFLHKFVIFANWLEIFFVFIAFFQKISHI